MPHPSPDRTPTGGDPADTDSPVVRRADQLGTGATGSDHDGTLTAQLDARDRSSAEDARAQDERRRAAAAKALAHLHGDAEPGDGPASAPTDVDTTDATAAPTPAAPTGPAAPLSSAPDDATPTPTTVPVPTGGPAAVVAQVFGAAAAEHGSATTPPLLELRPSTIGAGVDQLGDRVLIHDDRVEHRDRHGRLRRTVTRRDITEVLVHRRLTGTVLELHSRGGLPLVLKGLRPDAADEARRLLAADASTLRTEARPAFDEGSLLHKLVDLHRAGVLDEQELAAKTEVVARLARDHRDAGR